MLNRAQILEVVDAAYAARAKGDKAELARFWAPGATFHIVGDPRFAGRLPETPSNAKAAVDDLIDRVEFKAVERIDAIVEGHKAAIHWRVTMVAKGKAPVETELYDLWTFNDDGKVSSLLQFGDTAMLAVLLD